MVIDMQLETLIIWLVIGAIAGLLAGMVVKGGGFGLLGDMVVGILGAFLGGWLLPKLNIQMGIGIVPIIATATIGAILLLLSMRLIRRI
ncbi:MAG: GlsB/YeaQ/YmgE family stress response membrane protein [Rhizomicrobium sp.]|jgi:uncharacterized membrane protein YeaQ/YmgE (transglycosylase-associated protein family)